MLGSILWIGRSAEGASVVLQVLEKAIEDAVREQTVGARPRHRPQRAVG
jgi:hypothetical protein